MQNLIEKLKASPMFFVFLTAYITVHLHFEYNFWLLAETTIFDKYAAAGNKMTAMAIAERVYYAKAIWCFLLIILQASGMRFYTALSISFMAYACSLLMFFPIQIYSLLNLLLAVGMLIEVIRLGRHKA